MPKPSKIQDKANSLTGDDLKSFIEANKEYFDDNGMLKKNINITSKLNIPGIGTRTLRTIDAAAYLTKLHSNTFDDRLRSVLENKLYKQSQADEKQEFLKITGIENIVSELPTETIISESQEPAPAPIQRVLAGSAAEMRREQQQLTNEEQQMLRNLIGDMPEIMRDYVRDLVDVPRLIDPDMMRRTADAAQERIETRQMAMEDRPEIQNRPKLDRQIQADAAEVRQIERQMEELERQGMEAEDIDIVREEERQLRRQQQADAAEVRQIEKQIEGLERETMEMEDTDVLSFQDNTKINDLIQKQIQDLENQAMERQQMSQEDRDVISFLDDDLVNRAINQIMDEMMKQANQREQRRIEERDDQIRMRIRELIREGVRRQESPQIVSDDILSEAADEIIEEDRQLEQMLDEAAQEISDEPSAPVFPVGDVIPTARIIPEPIIPEDNRRFFMRDGTTVDFADESLEGRLRQIEFIASYVEELTNVPADVRETARVTIDTIREAKQNEVSADTIFSRAYRFGKGLLGAVAAIPLVPPYIRAGAAGTLIGVEAIEQTIDLVRGNASSTDAIRAGVNLAGQVIPGASEITEGINSGLDVLDTGLEIRDLVRTSLDPTLDGTQQQDLEQQLDQPVPEEVPEDPEGAVLDTDPADFKQKEKLQVLSGVSGPNEYYEPIHPDALGIYFKDSNFPEWDGTLFNDRMKRYSGIDYEVYVPYLQQQTRLVWEKHQVDLLIPMLKYQMPNDPPEMVIKENNEVIQLWNVIMKARTTLDVKKMMSMIDDKLVNIASDNSNEDIVSNGKEVTGEENEIGQGWKHHNNGLRISLNTSNQNIGGQKYFGDKETLAEDVTREGKPPVEDRQILSLGWSASGRRNLVSGPRIGKPMLDIKVKTPNYSDDTLNIRNIKNIRVK